MTMINSRTFDRDGFTWKVSTHVDESMGAPWNESDGHGIVSEWERRAKRPGEVIIAKDHGACIFYNVQSTQALAVRDGWSVAGASGMSRRAAAAAAVREDVRRMRAWCADEWCYVGIIVERIRESGREVCTVTESLWGIESDSGDYLAEVAEELMLQCAE